MAKVVDEFLLKCEVVPLHIERYDRQINRLLAVRDYSLEEVRRGVISRKEFYTARQRKIKAYLDCITTMTNKEKLLQFHSSGFTVEVISEKIEINKTVKSKYNLSRLSLDQMVQMLKLMTKAKKQQNYLASIIPSVQLEQLAIEEIPYEMLPASNIESVEIENLPAQVVKPVPISASDPTLRLRQAMEKLAAVKFKQAGGNLTEEEERLCTLNK